MSSVARLRNGRRSIRARILAIAWIPSIALLVLGLVAAGYLAYSGAQDRAFGERLADAAPPATVFINSLQEERRISIAHLVDPDADPATLQAQRAQVDGYAKAIVSAGAALDKYAPDTYLRTTDLFEQRLAQLPALRERMDKQQATVQDVYSTFSDMLSVFSVALQALAPGAPDGEATYQQLTASDLFVVADSMSRANALAPVAFSPQGMTDAEFHEYVDQVGGYHSMLNAFVPRLPAAEQAAVYKLQDSLAWISLGLVEDTIVRSRPAGYSGSSTNRASVELPITADAWQAASKKISDGLNQVYVQQTVYSAKMAADAGRERLARSLLIGLALLLIGVIAFVIATRMSTRLIGRLVRLREETLQLANDRLPAIVDRLRRGEHVVVDKELPRLAHGRDEIGQVADAFNEAQQTAVAAAAREAETRAGTAKVFLNIAHRSQVVVHRQLKVLDQAERTQEDPDQLNLLFQLDHLATRARRNAENLIIMGGGQPGRRWRNPVPLLQVVRSAIGEAERYTRVTTGQIPRISMSGAVVADLIHLMAELVDNATSFSPPTARVEVRGNLVGRGVVVEIEDQGLGIEPEQLEELNTMLHNPPDFSVMALSEEPRLGLFVVAQLASRNGIHVTLAESPSYGGIRAIVLIPSALIASPNAATPDGEVEVTVAEPRRPAPTEEAPIRLPSQPVADDGPTPLGNGDGADRVITLPPAEPLPSASPPFAQNGEAASAEQPRLRRDLHGAGRRTPPAGVPTTGAPADPAQRSAAPATPPSGMPAAPASAPVAAGSAAATPAAPVHPTATPATPATPARPAKAPAPPGPGPVRPAAPARGSAGPGAGGDMRPALPRRVRQTHIARQLLDDAPPDLEVPPSADSGPSAEHARARFAAFQQGTRRGRDSDPDSRH